MTTPRATYRLQLHPNFTFRDAAAVVDHLADLGVSHVYLSPSLQSAIGSTHGYDVVDPGRLNAELGGDDGFAELAKAVDHAGLGIVLDIVPNHLGLVSPGNPWWWDVLQHGPDSRWARHFDIDWEQRGDGPPQVVVAQLGRELEDEIADGDDLRLEHRDVADDGTDGFRIVYHEHAWPVRPGSVAAIGLDEDDPAAAVAAVAGDRGRLFSLLLQQHYRLVHWRRANEELNYRRFFDITTLGGLRVEDPQVFEDTHRRVLALVADGTVQGLRIDHPDGLHDPAAYYRRLRDAAGDDTWIVIEKILEPDERKRSEWPVDGTVGYEFTNLVLHLFLDPHSEGVLTDVYTRFLDGDRPDWEATVEEAKREVLATLFPAERRRLLRSLVEVCTAVGADCSEDDLGTALTEVLIDFPVYRTYVRAAEGELTDEDRLYIDEAVARVRARHGELGEALDVIAETLALRHDVEPVHRFVMAFQQLTGPVMAKGVEDTVFYRYLRFPAANEVGGHPHRLSVGLGEFHQRNRLRQRDWPATMLTTSTHDTKRSEDVRARLAVLTELPDLWVRAVDEWQQLAARHRGEHGPSGNHEHLAYHTIVGAWPIDPERLTAYLVKAAREEKRSTSWLDIDEAYEADLEAFARGLLADEEFVASVERLLDTVVEPGRITSVSQTLLKLTSPGVPDIYQGTELWDLSLVDPDNRRPVDHDRRRRLLAELEGEPRPDEVWGELDRGVPKLWVTRQALATRRERPEAFGPDASYDPLYAAGPREDHVVAFLRAGQVITIAPRLVVGLGGAFADWDWRGTTLELPDATWYDQLSGARWTGGEHRLAELLATFPAALLVAEEHA
ncbi:MAG: malto-oligosyltrehalose synthase [Actinobacteria bacterium]|nr:malto-oligosyltrehalose synthase [Actinomycetota bacterium]